MAMDDEAQAALEDRVKLLKGQVEALHKHLANHEQRLQFYEVLFSRRLVFILIVVALFFYLVSQLEFIK